MKIGIDVGSTTLKCVVLNDDNEMIFNSYERHFSQITEKTAALLNKIKIALEVFENIPIQICISGSAGMGFAEKIGLPFVQEVYATRIAVDSIIPDADVVIELGGEDAKILFLTGENHSEKDLEVRMNGSCAGGTGAFIDQMATLLNITPSDMNDYAEKQEKIYTVASRCGVFAKSDIQPLINQGAKLSDISASIFYAVVNQTIAGLAQGRPIKGKVVYLGGPLTFMPELRKCFNTALKLEGICPENSLYFVALGAVLTDQSKYITIDEAIKTVRNYASSTGTYVSGAPLFLNQAEYDEFKARHDEAKITQIEDYAYNGEAFLGVDAGSTTVKAVLINDKEEILYSDYKSNSGNPVTYVKQFLSEIYNKFPDMTIKSSAVTGYGEDIIKNGFVFDHGVVETIAHFTAAKKFMPDVDFIIDIGGQDIKCFKIRNGVIDNIFLNEACSSGCGSFLQTFAGALNCSVSDFAKLGLFAPTPVDLGSRCTVFMNSSVKQAQKDGASIECISAGLSISVVKNALYKVIRVSSHDSEAALGKNIIVQGGTFLNDAVLRAFEQEIKKNVIRPNISGLMGAYGAALYAKQKTAASPSTLLTKADLEHFTHEVKAVTCGMCSNKCRLTVNSFDSGRKYIGGNRCERPILNINKNLKGSDDIFQNYSIYEYKLQLLDEYKNKHNNMRDNFSRGKIGIAMGLNMYELFPFWFTILSELGFEIVTSPMSNRALYLLGQYTIPSDTVCFPAKLMHGHIESLIESNIDAIFYPCLTYNINEKLGDNHYNCPVVAYYPEVLAANIPQLKNGKVKIIYDYYGIHRPKDFIKRFYLSLNRHFSDISLNSVEKAVISGYREYNLYMNKIREKGTELIDTARKNGRHIIILAGRPYHADEEVNHGIDKLICSHGAVVISEDAVSYNVKKFPTKVLNQWTYHSRMYAAAKYVADKPDMNIVQLVSFGCGLDAVTTDEVRAILEAENKIYTQIKIDEITNLGAVNIRLRSLFAALENMKRG